MKDKTAVIVLFFCLLFIALFLGDGKQATIDVYGVAVVIVCWVFYLYKQKNEKRKFFPVYLLLPWVAVGIVAFVSTLFSASVGLSISWLARLVSGYLVYTLFFEISNEEKIHVFNISLLFLVIGASALSIVSQLWSGFREILPSMNLLDVRHGHSHLADLLVIVSPVILHIGTEARTPRFAKGSFILLFLFILLTTFARGAWIIVGLFFFYKFVASKRALSSRALTCALTVLVFVGIAGFYWRSSIVRPQTIGSRLEYWRQGIEAFKDHPLFGVGPGTFSLLSLQYQKSAVTFSWFAHSLPIQTAAEQGILGFIALSWLVIAQTQALRDKKNNQELLWGVVLIGAYSLFEFVLDYFLVWLLFWSSVGLLVGQGNSSESHKKGPTWQVIFPLGCIAVYYASSVLSTTYLLKGKYDLAFYIAPYDSAYALLFMDKEKQQISTRDVSLILMFHKKSPVILFETAELYRRKTDGRLAMNYYELAVEASPKNSEYQRAYAESFFKNGDANNVDKYLVQTCRHTTRTSTEFCSLQIRNRDKKIFFDALSSHAGELLGADFPILYQKVLYLAGLDLLKTNPEATRELWGLARIIEPTWGYYHVEFAALDYYEFGNRESAFTSLAFCQNYPYAQMWCNDLSLNLNRLPGAGTQEQFIRAIPKVL